jgi:hypothetical protein
VARSKKKLSRDLLEPLPRREELEALVRQYHHLQNEHQRTAVESSTRRRIEERLLAVRERFDRVLEEWVPEDELRSAWWEHLHNRAPAPSGPAAIRPLVFHGITDANSVVEVRGRTNGELEVRVDGAVVERVAAAKDLSSVTPPLSFRADGIEARETFTASAEALDALADFLADGGRPPPWDHASELLADGLIDTHFAVTPRGRRALASRQDVQG